MEKTTVAAVAANDEAKKAARPDRAEENARLLAAAQAGDSGAADRLVRDNIALVRHIARRFLGRGQELDDLVQTGCIGLLRAIRSFDLSRGYAFSTYAVPLIFGEIRRFLRDDGPIKVSRTQKRLGAALSAERERAAAEGRELSLSELSALVGVAPEEAAAALDATAPVASLSDALFTGEGNLTLESTLYDADAGGREFDRLALSMAIERLPDTERKIILLRYFRDMSQAEVAAALGLTQVKVSRYEKKIFAFLREQLAE